MHRISIKHTVFFVVVIIIGIISTAITPKYFGVLRILSLMAFVLGEVGVSFIPIIALYPKATPLQMAILGGIYFLTTLTICFGAWIINNWIIPDNCAFSWDGGEFHINTHAVFVANLFTLIALLISFRLVYDEELTKELHKKKPLVKGQDRARLAAGLSKPLLKRPQFDESRPSPRVQGERDRTRTVKSIDFDEDFIKPFEFEPEITLSPQSLPEESSGKLFSPEIQEKSPSSVFFEDEEIVEEIKREQLSKDPTKSFSEKQAEKPEFDFQEKPKPIQLSSTTPVDIKTDLAAIFEQYSSLNAVKKLTSNKTAKQHQQPSTKDSKIKRAYQGVEDSPKISVHIEGQDIHEASFRQISEAEKLEEIKEALKKELHEKIQEKATKDTQKIEETIQKTTDTKEEIIQSILSVKEELTKNLQEKIQEKINEQAQKNEETAKKDSETKDDIIQSIKSIKEDLARELQEKVQEKINEQAQKNEETAKKDSETKDDIIQSIKSIKEDLATSLKEELKKGLIEEAEIEREENNEDIIQESQEEVIILNERLASINKDPKVVGSMFVNKRGNTIAEHWTGKQILHKKVDSKIVQLFNSINSEINKTNQGNLCHLLLESENGTLVLAKQDNKTLTVHTEGVGELYAGQILMTLSEIETEED